MRARETPTSGFISSLLRAGTMVSTGLLAVGMAVALASPGVRAATGLLMAGLLILMATPVATLLVAIADEAAAGEWLFVAIGGVVIALLAGSLVVAFL